MKCTLVFDEDNISAVDAVTSALAVIRDGRVSNNGKQYCYVTSFPRKTGDIIVTSQRTRVGTDQFHIYKGEPK